MAAAIVGKLIGKFLNVHSGDIDLGELTKSEPHLQLYDCYLQNYIWVLLMSGSPWRFPKKRCRVGELDVKFAWYSLLSDDNQTRFVVKAKDVELVLENIPPEDFKKEMDTVLHRLHKKRKRLVKEYDNFLGPYAKKSEDTGFKEVVLRRLFKQLDLEIAGKFLLKLEGQEGTTNEGSSLQIWARKLSLHPPRSPTLQMGHTHCHLQTHAYEHHRVEHKNTIDGNEKIHIKIDITI